MKAKDTIIPDKELIALGYSPCVQLKLLEYQADLSFEMGYKAGIREVVEWVEQHFLRVGDIAVYEADKWCVHRIIKIAFDKEGRYFRFKGDHPDAPVDSYLVRDNMIRWILGIIVY